MRRVAPASAVLLVAGIALYGCARQEPAPPPASTGAQASGSLSANAATTPASTLAPAATAPAAAAPAAGPPAIASADGEASGVRAEVTEFKRTSGGTVSLKLRMINDSEKAVSFDYNFVDPKHDTTDFGGVGGIHLIDPVGKKKYFVARDTENKCVCSQKVADIPKGGRANIWAKFPSPPDDVAQLSIVIPHFSPLDDVPLSR